VTPLQEQDVHGRLDSAIEQALLADPRRLDAVARRIVDAQFPGTVAPDVLLAVGFDPEAMPVEPPTVAIDVRRRSVAWRVEILRAWDGSCAFCGYDGLLGGAPVGIEAAHVRWFNLGGPDDLDNGLALCSLHHKLFDRGALGLTEEQTIEVSASYRAVGPGRSVYDLHGQQLRPRPGTHLPAERHIDWHRTQVFRGDAIERSVG
jgi:putative restriction endonuclease